MPKAKSLIKIELSLFLTLLRVENVDIGACNLNTGPR